MPTLQKLRNFVAVAEERQFLRASTRLGITQPTLSAQIKELERTLGVALFSRTTRQIALTIEGQRFYQRAKQILSELEVAISEARDQAELKQGRIDIAATPSIAATILPQAMALFRHDFPDIVVRVTEDSFHGVEDLVRNGMVNFGIGPTMERHGDFTFSLLFNERFFAVLPEDHLSANAKSLKLADIAAQSIITTGYGTGISDVVEGVLRDNGLHLPRTHSLTRHDTVVAMVEAGLGVAILPELGLYRTGVRKVRIIPISEPLISRDIGVIERKGGSVSSAASAFLSVLQKETLLASFRL
jgi:LysR family carnitine catabolism transcriptional activator